MLGLHPARREGRTETIRASGPSLDRSCVVALGRRVNARAGGRQPLARARRHRCALVWLLASAVAALGTADALAAAAHKQAPAHPSKTAVAEHHKQGPAPDAKRSAAAPQSKPSRPAPVVMPRPRPPTDQPVAADPAVAALPPELAAAKQAIELVRQRKSGEAAALANSVADPVVQKLVEWALLRRSESGARFERYAAFIRANPDWP